jgi:hypothetical protein
MRNMFQSLSNMYGFAEVISARNIFTTFDYIFSLNKFLEGKGCPTNKYSKYLDWGWPEQLSSIGYLHEELIRFVKLFVLVVR